MDKNALFLLFATAFVSTANGKSRSTWVRPRDCKFGSRAVLRDGFLGICPQAEEGGNKKCGKEEVALCGCRDGHLIHECAKKNKLKPDAKDCNSNPMIDMKEGHLGFCESDYNVVSGEHPCPRWACASSHGVDIRGPCIKSESSGKYPRRRRKDCNFGYSAFLKNGFLGICPQDGSDFVRGKNCGKEDVPLCGCLGGQLIYECVKKDELKPDAKDCNSNPMVEMKEGRIDFCQSDYDVVSREHPCPMWACACYQGVKMDESQCIQSKRDGRNCFFEGKLYADGKRISRWHSCRDGYVINWRK